MVVGGNDVSLGGGIKSGGGDMARVGEEVRRNIVPGVCFPLLFPAE